MKTPGKSQQGTTVNRAKLAKLMGVSLPTIDDWQRRGCPVEESGGKGRSYTFRLADVITWRLKDERRRQGLPAGNAETQPDTPIHNPLRQLVRDAVLSYLHFAYCKPIVEDLIAETEKKTGCNQDAAKLAVVTVFHIQWILFAEWVATNHFDTATGFDLDAALREIRPGLPFIPGSLSTDKIESGEVAPTAMAELAHEFLARAQ